MEIRIYQIDGEKDTHRVMFDSLELMQKYSGKEMPDASIYENVYEGKISAKSLEDVYSIFNTGARPGEFRGHSLSVSDVVEVVASANIVSNNVPSVEPGFYYCDSIGFKRVEFDSSLAFKRDDLIKVVMLDPGEEARIVELDPSLRSMQCAVQGYIEAIALPVNDNVLLICNEEGKLIDLPPNRALRDPDNNAVMDVVVGSCFICGVKDGEFVGLSDKQLEFYKEMFLKPQEFTKNKYGEWKLANSLANKINEAENRPANDNDKAVPAQEHADDNAR